MYSAASSTTELKVYSSYLKKTQIYYMQARTYVYDSSYKKVYSAWSAKKYFISAPEVKLSASKKTLKSNSVTIKWGKVTGAIKYIVYCSTKSGSGYKKVGTTKSLSLKVTKFKGKTISFKSTKYFKIYAVTKAGGKTVKSSPYTLQVRYY